MEDYFWQKHAAIDLTNNLQKPGEVAQSVRKDGVVKTNKIYSENAYHEIIN